MKQGYLIIVVIIFFSNLFCEEELEMISSPFSNFEKRLGFEIVDFIYPNSYDFPEFQILDSLKFLISIDYLNIDDDWIKRDIENCFFKPYRDKLKYELSEIMSVKYSFETFNNFDINEDGIYEVFVNQRTPSGGYGESIILVWWYEENEYKLKNAFWGEFGKINENNNNYSLIVTTSFDGENTFSKIHEVSLTNFEIVKKIIFSSRLSIPINTDKIPKKSFTTIHDSTYFRVWPEEVNAGYYIGPWHLNSYEEVGNVPAIFPKNCTGNAFGKFNDNNNRCWFLVVINTSIQPIYVNIWNNVFHGEYLVGWIDSESLKFDE